MNPLETAHRIRVSELNRETKPAPTGARFSRFLPDGTPRISPSQVNLMLDCGEKYRRRYLMGEDEPGSAAAFYGTVFHACMEDLLLARMRDGDYVHAQVAADHARVVGANVFTDHEILGRLRDPEELHGLESADELAAHVRLAANWLMDKKVVPIGSEQTLIQHLEVDGQHVAVLGRYDGRVIVGGVQVMLDWKTSAKSPSLNPDGSGQVKRSHAHAGLTYADAAHAMGQQVDEVWVVYLVRTKTPKLVVGRVAASPNLIQWARTVSSGVIRLIQHGIYVANPNNNFCKPKGCSFWDSCASAPHDLEEQNGQ